jgi:hypothetical protein
LVLASACSGTFQVFALCVAPADEPTSSPASVVKLYRFPAAKLSVEPAPDDKL